MSEFYFMPIDYQSSSLTLYAFSAHRFCACFPPLLLNIRHQGAKMKKSAFENTQADILDRKQAENELKENLQAFMRTARDGFHIINSEGLLLEANQSFLNMLGYDESVVGHLHVDNWHATDDREFVRSKMAELFQQDTTAIFETKHRRKDGSLLDVEVSVSIFRRDGEPLMFAASRDITERKAVAMALTIANKELTFQNEEKEKRAAELAIANKELTFQNEEKEKRAAELAIANKELAFQNEEKEKRAAELAIANKELQDSLDDTVQAISIMVEMRDPYTAGHENRVAELSVAIAGEMGLPDEQIHSIHLGGMIHDLGKIQIPAEILSMPRRLTENEYNLVKGHPQAGYDILKDIDFPWPIAQMVLQHHERIDGSGYPQGLKGEAILLEARILCVADVVEAMSSHRPYRPGMGIEVALNEIKKNRGNLYDAKVVDACLKLFGEGRFKF